MHGKKIVKRSILDTINERLIDYPAVALLGSRQVGKSTIAKLITKKNAVYLDLERNSDLNKLTDPENYLKENSDKLICLDEVQRLPEIFPLLRSLIDESGKNGQFLILGSASRDLIKQSSESLAGRISYLEIGPFSSDELLKTKFRQHWLRGGYPLSYLARNDAVSFRWREDYIRTYLERDIPQLGFNIPAATLGRLWRMLAHSHGQLLNSSKLASSMGTSSHSIRKYIDLLEQTFLVRSLLPYEGNIKKRLIKSPKVYIRDTGLLHALLEIEENDDLYSNPIYGVSFEGYIIENIITKFPSWRPYFYRTSNGAEIDLILEKGTKRIAIEIKASTSPTVSKGFLIALDDLEIDKGYVIAPVKETFALNSRVIATNIYDFSIK